MMTQLDVAFVQTIVVERIFVRIIPSHDTNLEPGKKEQRGCFSERILLGMQFSHDSR